jgi:hypothetical protein
MTLEALAIPVLQADGCESAVQFLDHNENLLGHGNFLCKTRFGA